MFVFEEMEKMKKVLTILAILVILTSAVFAAAETHTIKVKADVTQVVPAFQLWLGEAKTNATPNVFTDNASYNEFASAAIDTGFNLDAAGTVTVIAKLANLAKINKVYTLTFSDGVFDVKRNGSDGTYAPSSIAATANTDEITGITSIDEADTDEITVTFNGTTVTAVSPTLATVVYSYPGDTEIDPNVGGTFYYANIVMEVATL